MASRLVSIAIPILDAGPLLDEVLTAVRSQRTNAEVELLVCDSGSRDRSVATARRHGARVIEIPRGTFSHGGTRNLLMREARGDVVVFLTQDAAPADDRWLSALLEGFDLERDVALVHGPYRPRPGVTPSIARELVTYFRHLAPNGRPVIDRATPDPAWRNVSSRATFFTDANGAVARSAWERVPFPEVPYGEDRLLALRMLEAGFAKAYLPAAAVMHSHDYRPWDLFRRYFDEFRGLRETFGHVEPVGLRRTLGVLRGQVAADRAWCRGRGAVGGELDLATLRSFRHYVIRAAASQIGSRADLLPARLRRAFSLERRSTFESSQISN